MAGNDIRNHIIEEYFHMGLSYKEIIDRLFSPMKYVQVYDSLNGSWKKPVSVKRKLRTRAKMQTAD